MVLFCYIQGKAWCLAAMIKLISAHAAYLRSVNADFFILKIFSASLLFNGLSSFTWDWDFDLSPQSCTCNNALSGIPGTTICWWSDLPKSSRVVNSFKTRPIIHWDSSGRGDMIKHSFHLRQQRWLIWDSPTRGIFEDWSCYWTLCLLKNYDVSLQGFTESLSTKVAQKDGWSNAWTISDVWGWGVVIGL